LNDEVVIMGSRFVSSGVFAALLLTVVPLTVTAQEAAPVPAPVLEGGSEDLDANSGAMVPPELAFVTDDDSSALEATDDGAEEEAPVDPGSLGARAFYDRYRHFNTLTGATGGFHLADPNVAMQGSFRIQLATAFFSSSDYLLKGDEVDATRYALSMNWTATDLIEMFATLTSSASSYEIASMLESGSNRSQTLQSTGDLSIGTKIGGAITDVFSFGGDARFLLNGGEGQGSPELAATGLSLRASASVDMRRQADPIPFIARFNLGYLIDNSAKLVAEREDTRYSQVTDPRPKADETRHLANRFERLAFGVNRVDTLGLGIGMEVPLFLTDDFYVHPLVEWAWGIPVNRQGYDCAQLDVDGVATNKSLEDGCLGDKGLAASPMTLSLGLRLVTPLRGFSAFAGIDIGLLGTTTFVRELAPTAPYAVLLGIAVDYDARPAQVQVVEREVRVESATPPPVTGRIRGTVVDQNSGSAVALASVEFVGRELSGLRAGDDGRFVSFDMPPGEVRLQVAHPDYEPGQCVAAITDAGGDVEARCSLAALPRKGSLAMRLADVWGAPLAGASVQINGPVVMTLNASAEGLVQSEGLAVGQYNVRIDAPNHYLRLATIEIAARQTTQLALTLTPRPGPSRAELRGTDVRLSGSVKFAAGSGDVNAALAPVIADVADLLLRNPQIARVRIEGPIDAGGDPMLALTRALSIKQRLVDAGVDASRINAIGGTTKTLKVVVE